MDNLSNTAAVERDSSEPVAEHERNHDLTARALDNIRGAERVSGFGRFATRVQEIFQGPRGPQASKATAHLRLAPILMSVGMLLLIATGLLFLISKPEGAVPGHFRQATKLTGEDSQKRGATAANVQAPITENQLLGGDRSARAEPKPLKKVTGSQHRLPRQLADTGNHVGNENDRPQQATTNELQTPATVFMTDVPSEAAAKRLNTPAMHSELQLPAGTEIVAHTTNAISSGLESPVIAVVDRNVELNDAVVIPQGTQVIGYTAGAVKDRINVRFTSALLPNNREIAISGLALMKDGSAGLVGKVQSRGHPILSSAAGIGTGTAVVAAEFAGQGSLNQPFSQADYLRNQMAAEAASEGSHLSNRLQRPMSVPIVKVAANQPMRIFLLNSLDVGKEEIQGSQPGMSSASANATVDRGAAWEQSLVAAQAAYIQSLEAQLSDMRAALNRKQPNGQP